MTGMLSEPMRLNNFGWNRYALLQLTWCGM